MSKDRVEGFSDGVFAVALTLLVLGIRIPNIPAHSTSTEYLSLMAPIIPSVISFILSFVIISVHWINHHYFFRHLHSTPIKIVWMNNFFLLWICFMPFPTAMLGSHPTDQFPLILFAINQLLCALTFFGFRIYATNKKLYVGEKESERYFGPRHSLPAIAIYTLTIVIAFVNTSAALAFLLLAPVLYFIPNKIKLE
ncbi:MAG TPA: TMEM175 family protein [Patescibacteria group bacterium]|nr:TMEM175 family protein [Patescibacteria group bacterium]